MSGWVKLWRKSLESGLLQNHELWAFWCWCLMKATHKSYKQMVGWQMVELQPGQFVFGRKQAAKELNLSERTVRTCLKKLQNLENLTIKVTNKYSIISIINWETYQQDGPVERPAERPAGDQQVTSKRPAGDHKQEWKNRRMEEEEFSSPNGDSSSPDGSDASKSPSKHPSCPHQEIVQIYHEELPELPIVQMWNGASRKNLQVRWREDSTRQSPEWWRHFFREYIRTSDFLMGRVKEFHADLDWIVKPANFQKILNGRYHNKGPNTGSQKTDQNYRVAQEWASGGYQQ